MRRRALLMGGKKQLPLIIRVDTTKSGATPSDTFRIPTTTSETYKYKVDWGDGSITSNHTSNAEHTYAIGGVYDIKIYGKFPRFYFNNEGDRLKLLETPDWGEIEYSANQTGAFWGCENLTFIATDANAWYNGITNGAYMFRDNSLTSLPDNMELPMLTNGERMFQNNSLTSLPYGMALGNLTNGSLMFYDNSLTTLPDGMELPLLTDGSYMFWNNFLISLPDGMELPLLTNGNYMFLNNSLTSLPDGMELPLLTNGQQMFGSNPITSAIGLKLYNIQGNATNFMNGANLPSNQYSNILIEIEANNPNDNVTIHFGSSKFNTTATEARKNLTSAPRNWIITDGGLDI